MDNPEQWPLCTASVAVPQSVHFVVGSRILYIDVNMRELACLDLIYFCLRLVFY